MELAEYTENHDRLPSANFQSSLLIPPNFEDQAAGPGHSLNMQSIGLDHVKGTLVANAPLIIKSPLVMSWNMEDFM